MPRSQAHMEIIEDYFNNKKFASKKIDLTYFKSGCLLPDIFYYYRPTAIGNKIKHLSKLWHSPADEDIKEDDFGLEFGELLCKLAETKTEKSFALGFLSHFMLDKKIHDYFDNENMGVEEHIIAEYFLDNHFMNYKIPKLVFPKEFILRVFEKEYPRLHTLYKSQIEGINKYSLFRFKVANKIINILIKKKYNLSSSKANKRFIDYLYNIIIAKDFKRLGIDSKNIINPDYSITKKHIPQLIKKVNAVKRELKKIRVR
jgi:hypothetical protein